MTMQNTCVGDSSSEANLSCLGFHRKDQYLLSPVNCWYLVLHQTRRESRDHATLNDIFMNNVIVRLSQISEDVIRLFKKVGKQATLPARISLPQAGHGNTARVPGWDMVCGDGTRRGGVLKGARGRGLDMVSQTLSLNPRYGWWPQPLPQPPPQKLKCLHGWQILHVHCRKFGEMDMSTHTHKFKITWNGTTLQ